MFFKAFIQCIFLITLFKSCDGFFTVVGSRTMLYKKTYDLFITRSDVMEGIYKLKIILKGLNSKDTRVEYVELNSNDNEYEKQVSFNLSQHTKVENFNLSVELDGTKVVQAVEIFMITEEYTTLIQTDKSIFKPGDDIKYRVLVLDADTKPYQGKKFEVTISDSMGNFVSEKSDSLIYEFDDGWVDSVFQGSYRLSDSSPLGDWNISVNVEDRYLTTKSFQVAEHVLPRFRVHIDCKSTVLLSDKILEIQVFGEYTFEEYVQGNATVTVEVLHNNNLNSAEKIIIQQGKISSKRKFEFNFKNDLSLTASSRVRVNVIIEEEHTGKRASDSQIVYVIERGDPKIELKNDERNFKPGFPFTVRAIVRTFNDEPLENNEMEKVKFNVNVGSNWEVITEEKTLVNSEADLTISIPKEASIINISVTFKGTSTSKFIACKPWKDFLKASLIRKRNHVGEFIRVKVESTQSRQKIYALISGHHKMTHRTISNEKKFREFEFEVELTSDMTPTLNIIVYYIHDYGEIIYDRLKVDIDNSFGTQYDVTWTPKLLSPGASLSLKMKSAPNAVICLSAVDESVLYEKTSNHIDEKTVLAEQLKFKPSLIFDQLKVNGIKSKFEDFGEINSFLLTNANGDFEKIQSRFGDYDILNNYDYPDNFDEIFDDAKPVKNKRMKFSETWMFECSKTDQYGVATKNTTVPDTITSWILSGFSLDPKYGLIPLQSKKIIVKLNFFIKLNLPYSIRLGEILKIDVLIFNYLDRRINTSVEVQLFGNPSFEIIKKASKCSYMATVGQNETNIISVAQGFVGNAIFYIRPLETGKIKLNIKASGREINVTDEIEKELIVEHDGITYYKNKPIWIDLSNGTFNMTTFTFHTSQEAIHKSIKYGGSIIGDLLGPAILDVSKLIRLPTGCGEQRLINYVPTVVAAKYLISINKLTRERRKNTNKILKIGYNQILERKNEDGSYNLWGFGKSESIWLTAYVMKCLIHSKGLLVLNEKHIYDGLNYLKSKQHISGSFTEHGPINHRRVQGGVTNGVTLTAYILISFLENPGYAIQYKETIDRSLKFINSQVIGLKDDYACAISAYAMVLANHSTAAEILDQLSSTAQISEDQMYWTKSRYDKNEESNIAHDVELAAYALLAFLKHGDTLTAISIMNWLMTKRNAEGGFYSTQDTVIGIQAIAEMANMFYFPNVNMNVKLTYDGGSRTINVNSANRLNLQNIEIPSNARYFHVDADGTGKALLNIWHTYKSIKKRYLEVFNLTLKVEASKNKGIFYLTSCINFIAQRQRSFSGMSLVEINLPSGYAYDSDSTPFLIKTLNVRKVETRDQKSIVILYLDRITTDRICPEIIAIQVQVVEQLKSSSVKVYEYSDSDNYVIDYYTPSKAQSCF